LIGVAVSVDAANRANSSSTDGIELDNDVGSVTNLFPRASANLRSDRYGGPVGQRSSFAMELGESRWAHAVSFSALQIDAQFLNRLRQGFDRTDN
jgi:2,4-dienoyl-CoA reductase-like NADH-dependent reductase (Old Yellow Enzyme family)